MWKKRERKATGLVLLILILICVTLFLPACDSSRPAAVLHDENAPGFIPCVSEQLDIELLSGQAFVYSVHNNEFLFLKGSSMVIYPASTTKLLTILYALELLELDELVTPGNELELVGAESSIAYIKSYHKLSVEMLIEGMLLPSGNDAAYVLAAAAGKRIAGDEKIDGREAIRHFIIGMNGYAEDLGMCGSSFTSPDGYYDEDHYTTIEDIALVAKIASQNEIITKYAAMDSDNVTYASGHTNYWSNTNLMIDPTSTYYNRYVTGLKTGSAGAGHYSLICTLNFGGEAQQYIVGIFSSATKDDRYRDAAAIIECLQEFIDNTIH